MFKNVNHCLLSKFLLKTIVYDHEFWNKLNWTGAYFTVCLISPLFHSRWGSWLFPHSTRIIQKSSPRNLFFQLVLLFISSSSQFPYFSSLKSGLIVPKQADMKLTNAKVSTLAFCCTPQTGDTIHSKRWNNATFIADFNKLTILS